MRDTFHTLNVERWALHISSHDPTSTVTLTVFVDSDRLDAESRVPDLAAILRVDEVGAEDTRFGGAAVDLRPVHDAAYSNAEKRDENIAIGRMGRRTCSFVSINRRS